MNNEGDELIYENIGNEEEEELFQYAEGSQETDSIIVVEPDIYDISEPFFLGVRIAGVMCMLSLGIAMVLKMFRRA